MRTIRGADTTDWDRQDLDEQRQRLRTLSIEDRLQEAIAWSAALLTDARARSDPDRLVDPADPVGLGARLS